MSRSELESVPAPRSHYVIAPHSIIDFQLYLRCAEFIRPMGATFAHKRNSITTSNECLAVLNLNSLPHKLRQKLD